MSKPEIRNPMEEATISIQMTVNRRWIPEVVSMLRRMEQYGAAGMSRNISIMSDGDGDFRPKFVFLGVEEELLQEIQPVRDEDGNLTFDAG